MGNGTKREIKSIRNSSTVKKKKKKIQRPPKYLENVVFSVCPSAERSQRPTNVLYSVNNTRKDGQKKKIHPAETFEILSLTGRR